MDDLLVLLQAKLDEAKSKGNINTDIDKLQGQLNKLKIQAEIDPKSISNITQQMSKLGIQIGQDFGKSFNNGLQSTINTNVLNQINKISDSSTSTIVQNEKKKQEAYKATSDAVVYHAGVISKLNKAETNGRFYGSNRGTGYFGTGHYFVDSNTKHELDNNSSYSKLPYTSVDISKYDNLFKATTDEIASKLHSFLENLTKFTQGSDKFNVDELFSQFKNVFTDTTMDIKDFGDKMEQLKTFMSNSNLSDRSDSVSTQFMKSLGYGGVDTRGTKYADTRYGTVIYDLKEESILQANITDELQKQGQMLEKINYEKGQVFDSSEDARIQDILDKEIKSKEIVTEFNKIFDSTNLEKYESELDSVNEKFNKNKDIIDNCRSAIETADEDARRFAKDMEDFDLFMSEEEIVETANKNKIEYQERIDELEKEQPLLEERKLQLEANLDTEYKLANAARQQAEQIVEQRRLETQQSSTTANEVIQNEEKKQQAIQETIQLKSKLTDFNNENVPNGIEAISDNGIIDLEKSADKIRETYSELGKVTTQTVANLDDGISQIKVKVESTDGELKRAYSFLMDLSEDGKSFVFNDESLKYSENVVRKLNEQKDATDQITQAEEKLANEMADVREKSEQVRQAEQKRQELAQNKVINKSLEDEYKQRQKLVDKVHEIQLSMDTGETESKIEALISRTNQWTDVNENARISTQSLTTALDALELASNEYIKTPTEEKQKELIEANEKLSVEYKKVASDVRSMNATLTKDSAVDSLRLQYQNFYSENGRAHKKFGEQLKSAMSELARGAEVPKHRLEELKSELIDIKTVSKEFGLTGQTWLQNLGTKIKQLSTYISGTVIIGKLLHSGKQVINFSRELDKSITNINYTMDVSSDKLADIGKQSIDTAKDLKTSAENVLAAVTTYANANETAESILSKSKPTIMLSNVTGMDTATTTDILQGTIHQFDLDDTEEELYHVSDVLQSVSKSMAVDFSKGIKEMAEGIQVSGSVANDAGYDLERYSAILGNLIEKTRQSGSELGRSLRTMFVRTTKASTSALAGGEVTEEDLSNAEAALRRVGIEVRDGKEEFRDFDAIMTDLYNKIDDLSEVDLSNIAYEVASTRQTAVFKVMVKTWGDYLNLSEQAYNASGETLENQEKYAESLQGKFEGLGSTIESIYSNLANSNDIGIVVDGFQKIADAVDITTDKLGLLGTISTIGSGYAGAKGLGLTNYVTITS